LAIMLLIWVISSGVF